MLRNIIFCMAVVALLAAGGCGTKPDLDALQTRAEQGDANAQLVLGLRYYNGDGVLKSYVEAYKWFLIADASSHQPQSAASKKVAKAMTPEQLAEGQERAQKWLQAFEQTHPTTK